MDPELSRKNLRLGLILLGITLILLAGSFAIAVIYDAVGGPYTEPAFLDDTLEPHAATGNVHTF